MESTNVEIRRAFSGSHEDDDFLTKMCGKNDNQEAMCMEATAKAIVALIDAGEEL